MDVDEAKKQLDDAIEAYAKTVNDDTDTLHGYILQIVTSNINDLSRNWHSDLIRPAWQPYYATLGLLEYAYRNFGTPDEDD